MAKAKIVTNTLYQLLAKIISTFSTLIITIIITRSLGPKAWGDYAIVTAYITFFYVFTEFGINSIGVKYFTDAKAIKFDKFFNFFLVRLLYTIIVIVLAYSILPLFNYPENIADSIKILFIALFCFSLSSSFNAVYQTKLLYKNLFYSTLVFGLTNLATFLVVVFILKIADFKYLFLSLILAELTKLVVSYFLAKRHIEDKLTFQIDKKLFTYFLKASLPLGVAIAFNTLMTQIDKLMLSVMVNPEQVGYYALSYKLFDLVLVVPTFFMNAVFPLLNEKSENVKKYSEFYSKSYVYLAFFSVIISLISIFLAPIMIPIVWGNAMAPAVLSFQILIFGAFIFYLSSPVSWIYVIENKQHLLIVFYAIGFCFNYIANLIAITLYGYIGAALITGFTELLILLMLEVYRVKCLKARFLYKNSFIYLTDIFLDIKNLVKK